jgi:hypothetical protein
MSAASLSSLLKFMVVTVGVLAILFWLRAGFKAAITALLLTAAIGTHFANLPETASVAFVLGAILVSLLDVYDELGSK